MIARATVDALAPLMVRLDTGDVALPAEHLASYIPVIGDRVVVDTGSPIIVLGKVVV